MMVEDLLIRINSIPRSFRKRRDRTGSESWVGGAQGAVLLQMNKYKGSHAEINDKVLS